jgi:hypothetical protein
MASNDAAGNVTALASARMKVAAGTRRRARSICTSLMSTPVTWYPAAAKDRSTGTPQPQPRSSTEPPAGSPSRNPASQGAYRPSSASSLR